MLAAPLNSPLAQGKSWNLAALPGETTTVDSSGCVWAGKPPSGGWGYDSKDGVPLGYTSLKPIQALASQMGAPLVIMPDWTIDYGVVLVGGGGILSAGFVRPTSMGPFVGALSKHAKASFGGSPGLIRPLSAYGQVAYAYVWPTTTGPSVGPWFKTSFFG